MRAGDGGVDKRLLVKASDARCFAGGRRTYVIAIGQSLRVGGEGGHAQGAPTTPHDRKAFKACVTWMSRPMRKFFLRAGKRGSATFLGVDLTCFFMPFFATT